MSDGEIILGILIICVIYMICLGIISFILAPIVATVLVWIIQGFRAIREFKCKRKWRKEYK
ncbi:hypothetical protein SFC25_17580 [Terribacillus saccharophilus]